MVADKKKTAEAKKNVVCISGMAGTGKSTLAKRVAAKYGLNYYSGGDALRALAAEQGYDSFGNGWWESPDGLRFLEQRKADPAFDKKVDEKLLEYAKEGNVLLDSWTMPWLLNKGFKIWLMASMEKRAQRVAKRDNMTLDKALQVLKEKEERTKAIYKKLYGFILGEDFKPFDVILDTENMSAREVYETLCHVIDNMILKNNKSI